MTLYATAIRGYANILAGRPLSSQVTDMLFRNRRSYTGLYRAELTQLSTYNAECARGLCHTVAWQTRMAALQQRYDDARREAQ